MTSNPAKTLRTKNFTYSKKTYVHEIAAVDLSKIYFLKNAMKTCKPNNRDLNRDWTILATRQEFFFTKVASVQSITCIAILDFLLMLLSWMFTLSYTTIYFFVNKFIFSNVYSSECNIRMSLFVFFLLRKGLNTYDVNFGRGVRGVGGKAKMRCYRM